MKVQGVEISDRARRCSEAVDIAILSGASGKWLAVKMSDGTTDGNIYDTLKQARKHQLHLTQCAYLKIPPMRMPILEAHHWLNACETAYDAGFKISDPDDDRVFFHG